DQVRLPIGAEIKRTLIKRLLQRAAEMQIAQMENREALPGRREIGKEERLLRVINLKDMVSRKPRQASIPTPTHGLVSQFLCDIDGAGVITCHDNRLSGKPTIEKK